MIFSVLKTNSLFFKRHAAVFRYQNAFLATQSVPSTVDLNLLGRCNLNCTWCWGPEHHAIEPIRLNEWKELVKNLQRLGTRQVIITGGEPLLKSWLPHLIQYIKQDLAMRVTLSTNGILLKRKADLLLPYIDDLGIPLDGPSHEINKMMRVGKYPHFDIALEAIKFVQSTYPNIDLTVRTVVAKPNLEYVPHIGIKLSQHGIHVERLRWKLYQVNPIGPRKKDIVEGEWLVSSKEFEKAVHESKMLNPTMNIRAQSIDKHAGRYFMIFPDGMSHVVEQGDDGFPREKYLGNVFENFDGVLKELTMEDQLLENNDMHGVHQSSLTLK
jgi:Fe-coproporphyrin III synthase